MLIQRTTQICQSIVVDGLQLQISDLCIVGFGAQMLFGAIGLPQPTALHHNRDIAFKPMCAHYLRRLAQSWRQQRGADPHAQAQAQAQAQRRRRADYSAVLR